VSKEFLAMAYSPTGLLAALALAALFAAPAPAQVITDDFNDGNDTGWARYQPLQALGAPGTWSFPGGNSYRIQAAPTPNLGQAGPGRAGSFRTDQSYTDFIVSSDVLDWNNSATAVQSFGLGARIQQPGLGTTDGYALLYDSIDQDVTIYRIDNEAVTTLAVGDVVLDPANDYRFEFQGQLGTFTARVFNLTNPTVPLVVVTNATPDTTYAAGITGYIVAENTSGATGGADATYDNFRASPVPEPGSLALAAAAAAGGWVIRRRRG
jgi:hypothetical protein